MFRRVTKYLDCLGGLPNILVCLGQFQFVCCLSIHCALALDFDLKKKKSVIINSCSKISQSGFDKLSPLYFQFLCSLICKVRVDMCIEQKFHIAESFSSLIAHFQGLHVEYLLIK